MNQIIFCQRYDPLKLVCYFQKYVQKFKTASTAAATTVVAVYYIKTA